MQSCQIGSLYMSYHNLKEKKKLQQIVLRFLNLAYLHILRRKNCKLTSLFFCQITIHEINKQPTIWLSVVIIQAKMHFPSKSIDMYSVWLQINLCLGDWYVIYVQKNSIKLITNLLWYVDPYQNIDYLNIETPSSIDKSPSSGVHIHAAEAAETTPNLF